MYHVEGMWRLMLSNPTDKPRTGDCGEGVWMPRQTPVVFIFLFFFFFLFFFGIALVKIEVKAVPEYSVIISLVILSKYCVTCCSFLPCLYGSDPKL
ncbi:hypothetical protein AGOR_G00156980 [Albula goreensis]|uniref:Uncharacterized protein n=1 Tax=Albula goreensis TaxID=1534307 RepID=A0A8T3D4X7_9TELE|nr:hypothetical protein AGOR_G00156980 [Albula goreensis]